MSTALLMLLATTALASDLDALLSDQGWADEATPTTEETGVIDLETKVIEGDTCVRGTAVVQADVDLLLEVVADIPSVVDWSSETMIASRVLGRKDGAIEYYQHLDVPGWTMASDRFWVLRGHTVVDGATKSFRWDRFDWRSAYPELAAEVARDHEGAVEPDPNYGYWSFTPRADGVEVGYGLCTNSGSLPNWLQKAAATKTLPGTMADAVREAQRRAKR